MSLVATPGITDSLRQMPPPRRKFAHDCARARKIQVVLRISCAVEAYCFNFLEKLYMQLCSIYVQSMA